MQTKQVLFVVQSSCDPLSLSVLTFRNSITRFIWQQESWSSLPHPPHHWSQWGPHPQAPPSRPSWTSPSLSSLLSLNLPRTLREEDLMLVLRVGNLHSISMIRFWIYNFSGTFSLEILGTATSRDRLLPPSCHGCLHCIVDLEKYLSVDTTCFWQKHHSPNNTALLRDVRASGAMKDHLLLHFTSGFVILWVAESVFISVVKLALKNIG